MSVPSIDLNAVRREVAAEFGLKLAPDDPVLASAAIAVMATRQLLAEERAKRADENLLTSTDVREVLMDVRKDSLHYSREIVALALEQFGGAVREDIEVERKRVGAVVIKLMIGISGLMSGIATHAWHSF